MAKAANATQRKRRETRIRNLAQKGYSRGEIAKKMGLSYDTVKRALDPQYKERCRQRRYSGPRIKDRPAESRWLIPEDGIIDLIAIDIAVSGRRVVRLTPIERTIAAKKIIARGGDLGMLRRHLGLANNEVKDLLEKFGYRVVRGKWGGAGGPGVLVPHRTDDGEKAA